jgi:hypothetical protein
MERFSIEFINIVSFQKHSLYDFELPFDDKGKAYGDDERDEVIAIRITNCTKIPQEAFFHCDKLRVVIMDDCVEEIGNVAFFRCFSLEYIRLSRNTRRIGRVAFAECKSLPSLFIPQGCKEIGRCAFEGCESLTILNVPMSVQFIDISVSKCDRLLEHSEFTTTDENAFQDFIRNRFKHLHLHQICCSSNLTSSEVRAVISKLGSKSCLDLDYQGMTALHILMANPYLACHDTAIVKELLKVCPEAGSVWDKFGKLPVHYLVTKPVGCSLDLITLYRTFCPVIQCISGYNSLVTNAYSCQYKASTFSQKVIRFIFHHYCPSMDVSDLELTVADYLKHCPACDL